MSLLPDVEEIDEIDRLKPHPLHTTIHRRVTWLGNEDESKQYIPIAREIEYSISAADEISMSGQQGISCSCNCCYAGQVNHGSIPFDYLKDLVDDTIRFNGDQSLFFVNSTRYPVQKCYRRQVPSTLTDPDSHVFTVGMALDCNGKHNKCLLDERSNFSLYFTNKEHGIICLKDPVMRDSNICRFGLNREVVFLSPYFDLDAWTPCGTIFVVMPKVVNDLLRSKSKKGLGDILKQKSENDRRVIQHLSEAFTKSALRGSNETTERINDLLEKAYLCDDISEMSLDDKEEICDVIEEYLMEVEDYTQIGLSEFDAILRPYLISNKDSSI